MPLGAEFIRLKKRPPTATEVLNQIQKIYGFTRQEVYIEVIQKTPNSQGDAILGKYRNEVYATKPLEDWYIVILNNVYNFDVSFYFAWLSEELNLMLGEAKKLLKPEKPDGDIGELFFHIKQHLSLLSKNKKEPEFFNYPKECYLAHFQGNIIAPIEAKPYLEAFNKIISLEADDNSRGGFNISFGDPKKYENYLWKKGHKQGD